MFSLNKSTNFNIEN